MSGGGVSGHIGGLQGWGMDGRWWRVSVSTCVQLFSRGSERERRPSMMVSVDCGLVRLACCDLSSDDRGRISGEAAADSRGVKCAGDEESFVAITQRPPRDAGGGRYGPNDFDAAAPSPAHRAPASHARPPLFARS